MSHPPIPATATAAERQIIRLLQELNRKADIIMGVQDDINTAAATLVDGTSQILTAVQDIQAGGTGAPVDTSALNAALPPFVQAVQSLGAAVVPPTPAPGQPSSPVPVTGQPPSPFPGTSPAGLA